MQRRKFIKHMAAATVASLTPVATWAAPSGGLVKRFYMDGLSFLPDEPMLLEQAGLNAFIADISSHEAVKMPDGRTNYKRTYSACIKSIQEAKTFVRVNSDRMQLARNAGEINKASDDGKSAVIFQIQGADCVEGGFHQLAELQSHGLHVLQLTHHYGNKYAGGALDIVSKGLSADGFGLIDELNRRKMIIDLSHSSVKSAEDALRHTEGRIIQTHGAARAIVDNARCTPDHIIRGIADKGGVFGIFMMSFWLTNDAIPTKDHYLAHIKHVINVAGIDAIGVANDYPIEGQRTLLALNNNNKEGVKQYVPWWKKQGARGMLGFESIPVHVVIPEFNHIARLERIDALLAENGFTAIERDKIMGKNWLRVFE